MKATTLFYQNYCSANHVVVNQGGTSSGKTYAILQALFCIACNQPGMVITVVAQDIPNLKAGALRDASAIYHSTPIIHKMVKNYNRSDRIYEFYNGSLIEFNSYHDGQDAKSGKRDYLFINEANGVPYEVYTELSLRTKKRIYIDYNPNTMFWVHDHVLGRPGVQLIISDHRHNPYCEPSIRAKTEALYTENYELWRVYARGLTGKVAGLVLSNWHICEEIPPLAKRLGCGLDFGFSNDQTGCVEVFLQNGELWVNELFYERGLTNPDISTKLLAAGVSKQTTIIGDSAEPKSIEELRRMGWNISGAIKGPGTVNLSIDILKRYRINVTRNSANLINELGRYKWRTDNSGRTINEPDKSPDHLIDPLRYIALNRLRVKSTGPVKSRLPWKEKNFGVRDFLPLS